MGVSVETSKLDKIVLLDRDSLLHLASKLCIAWVCHFIAAAD